MEKSTYQLILASKSPRRKELLKLLGIPFQIETSQIEEKSDFSEPEKIVCDLACQKGEDVFSQIKTKYSSPFVIASDTIVVFQGEVLGKPKDKEEAKATLLKLENNTHQVFTGVSFHWGSSTHSFWVETKVVFGKFDMEFLDEYIASEDSLDKAGSYGIQGAAAVFIKEIHGNYQSVIGFPMHQIQQSLKEVLEEDLKKCFIK